MHKQFTRSSLSLQGCSRFSTVFTRAINTTFLKEKTSNNKKCSADGGGWAGFCNYKFGWVGSKFRVVRFLKLHKIPQALFG